MTLAVALLALVALFALALVARLFWPAAQPQPGPDSDWDQHNEQRMPSLENAPHPGSTEVDAAVAAQINGVD